ncbi:MAG: hypothetical protein NXI32_13505 [bacterium]|nr:hypothetical protein [bacterium]
MARPLPGDVGDFLGIGKPIRPTPLPGRPGVGDRPGSGNRPGIGDRPGSGNRPERPGSGNRPSLPGNRPGIGDRPDFGNRPGRPGVDRPGLPGNRPDYGRPGWGDRPINIGNINIGSNNIINNRPSWVNIDRNQINNIHNRWQGQLGGMYDWRSRYPARGAYWNGWADGVRSSWGHYHHHGSWFGPNWWGAHRHTWCGWHYGYGFNRYPWNYWWTVPTFAACTSWFNWSAPASVWSQPVYYDYGQGGNVVYENNIVYMNGQQVATAEQFAQSAAELATVPPPPEDVNLEEEEWLPLGTFAVSSDEKDLEPSRVMQLAVNRDGIISGTLYNLSTDQADSIQGQVDKETQRVAFRVGESEDVIVESGLYNLTQEEAPVLVHFGTERVEDWLLIRLESPEDEQGDDA